MQTQEKNTVTEIEKIVVTEAETAEILSCCQKTVFNERKAGRLPFVMIGSRPMYRLSTLREVMAAREQTVS